MSESKQRYVEPLFLCIQRGDLRYLTDLFAQDPDSVNACDESGQTLLHYACSLGQVEIVIDLINRHHCSVSKQDLIYGHTPLHTACLYNQLCVAVEVIKKVSSDTGHICTPDKFGWTALHHAARNGNVDLCKILVANDCRPHLQNMLGKTACHYAAEYGHVDVLSYLYHFVEKRVCPPILPEDIVSPMIPTLLHCAATHNHLLVVEWLQKKTFPPHSRCRRLLDLDKRKTRDDYAEDVAACRGYNALRGVLSSYRMVFESWIKDIQNNIVPLDRIKLCICGHARVGKSAMRESLGRPYLQQILGLGVNLDETSADNTERCTFGIDIRMMHLSGKDIFSVWDFAGQVDSFITHDFFISTQSTVFTVLVKLTSPIEVQRSELLWWLGFIKVKNLGQVSFTACPLEEEIVPMSTVQRLPQATKPPPQPTKPLPTNVDQLPQVMKQTPQPTKPLPNDDQTRQQQSSSPVPQQNGVEATGVEEEQSSTREEGGGKAKADGKIQKGKKQQLGTNEDDDNNSIVAMYGSFIQPVHVVIVGSHYDQLESHRAEEAVQQTQLLVTEMREQFKEYLDISGQLYPLNCLKSVSPEIRALKGELCTVRSKLVEVQPKYPRVMEKVARQIESLRAEQPQTKVLSWESLCEMVRNENQLLSDRQLSYICRCLADAGVIVYFEEGALSNHIIIDPAWLCKDVLGRALAPENFPRASLSRVGSYKISQNTLQQKLLEFVHPQHMPIIVQLLQSFDLCHYNKEEDVYCFPAFLTETLDSNLWRRSSDYYSYIGRRLVCSDITDSFPPGFFSRLQIRILASLKSDTIHLFKGSVLIDGNGYQCLVDINLPSTATSTHVRRSYSNAVTLRARAMRGHAQKCCSQLDLIQTMIAQLVREACPTIFLELRILSSSDLKAHSTEPHSYTTYEVMSAEFQDQEVTNDITSFRDSPLDLLYLGDKTIKTQSTGRYTKVAYLSEDIVQRIEALLEDGDTDWRNLALKLGLGRYIQLLENRRPHSTRSLLLKWGEKPRWTVESLLFALRDIGRQDVANFIRAQMGLPN